MKLQNEASGVEKKAKLRNGNDLEKKMKPQGEESAAEKKMIPKEEKSTTEEKAEAHDVKRGWVKKLKILVIIGFVKIVLHLLKLFFN